MSFKSPYVLAVLSAALVLLSARSTPLLRRTVFTVANVGFTVLFLEGSIAAVAVLAAFLLGHFGTLWVMARCTRGEVRHGLFWGWLVAALVAFVVVKQYRWLLDAVVEPDALRVDVVTIGLSFVLFRQLALSTEVRDATISAPALLEYVNFNLAFWTFVAGPLQRFDSFRAQERQLIAGPPLQGVTVLRALNRSALGFLKIFVVAAAVGTYAVPGTFLAQPDVGHLVLLLVAFPTHVYVNFSGYCDIVIGLAAAVGFQLPENFLHPYRARNMNEFWARWHVTLSDTLRDYLYFPLQTVLARRIRVLPAMVVASMTSFLVMGTWHGSTAGFAAFGLLHGLGVVVVNLYGQALKWAIGKAGRKRYMASSWVRGAAVALCQAYVVLTFLPFCYWEDLPAIGRGVAALIGGAS